MSDTTTHLLLPYIMAAQAQKHVTHNEALRLLDGIVQLAVRDRDRTAPPDYPADGDRYIVASGATGGWAGWDLNVALSSDGAWLRLPPRTGWLAWVEAEDLLLVWDGTTWVPAAGLTDPAPQLGITTSADATNRLAVAAPATLFTHDGGGHQLKINKAAPGDTASLLFQTGWSGRAEMGLAGDDDYHFKVSPDGSAWYEAIVIEAASGRVRLPATPRREILDAARTYHVNPAPGSDANDGLSSASPFQTIQKAIDAALNVDAGGHAITIQLADGTYTNGGRVSRPMFDGSQLTILGNPVEPGNVAIAVSGANAFLVDAAGAKVRLEGLSFSGDVGVWARYGGVVFLTGKNDFGACGFRHIGADNGGFVEMLGGEITIEGAAPHHLYADAGGRIFYALGTTTVGGSPGFPFGFAYAQAAALITSHGMTWSGNVLGPRYQAVLHGVINVNGSGPDFFPGDSAGVLASGGQYA